MNRSPLVFSRTLGGFGHYLLGSHAICFGYFLFRFAVRYAGAAYLRISHSGDIYWETNASCRYVVGVNALAAGVFYVVSFGRGVPSLLETTQ